MPLYRYERIPAGYKSIGRGISLVWSGNSILLSCTVEISGTAGSQAMADAIQATIERVWNASFDEGYQVRCVVNATYQEHGNLYLPGSTNILIREDPGPSFVEYHANRYSYMSYHTWSDVTWVPAHEFGHMLGLRDHYDEAFYSLFIHQFGYDRVTSVQPGWEGNIMARDGMPLQKINLQEILALHCMRMVTIADDVAASISSGISALEWNIRSLYPRTP